MAVLSLNVSDGGTYTLLLQLEREAEIEVGALGDLSFDPGWYAYVGSAHGPGGFARVDRHREVASGEHDARHWHVDYLLDHAGTEIATVVTSEGVDAECEIARAIDGDRIDGFGASDCECDSHLVYSAERAPLERAVEQAHETVR